MRWGPRLLTATYINYYRCRGDRGLAQRKFLNPPESTMTHTISTLEIRRRLGDILNRIALRHDQYVIERKGKPMAAMIPVEKLERMERLARRHLLEVLERQRGGSLSNAEGDAIADEAKHLTRKRRTRKECRG